VTDGVTVLASTWLSVIGTDIVILTNDVTMVGTYNFELSWNWNDGFAYNQDKVFTFAVDIKCKVLSATVANILEPSLSVTIFAPATVFALGSYL
jgi:hypothetical protein